MAMRGKLFGQLLIDAGVLTPGALNDALAEQSRSGRRLGEVLQRKGIVDEADVAKALSVQLNLAYVAGPFRPEPDALAKVQPKLARTKGVLPLSLKGRRLTVAMADPLDGEAVDDLRFQSGCRVDPVAAPAVGRGPGGAGSLRRRAPRAAEPTGPLRTRRKDRGPGAGAGG